MCEVCYILLCSKCVIICRDFNRHQVNDVVMKRDLKYTKRSRLLALMKQIINTVDSSDTPLEDGEFVQLCSRHSFLPYSHVCETCRKLICGKCLVEIHQSHSYVSVEQFNAFIAFSMRSLAYALKGMQDSYSQLKKLYIENRKRIKSIFHKCHSILGISLPCTACQSKASQSRETRSMFFMCRVIHSPHYETLVNMVSFLSILQDDLFQQLSRDYKGLNCLLRALQISFNGQEIVSLLDCEERWTSAFTRHSASQIVVAYCAIQQDTDIVIETCKRHISSYNLLTFTDQQLKEMSKDIDYLENVIRKVRSPYQLCVQFCTTCHRFVSPSNGKEIPGRCIRKRRLKLVSNGWYVAKDENTRSIYPLLEFGTINNAMLTTFGQVIFVDGKHNHPNLKQTYYFHRWSHCKQAPTLWLTVCALLVCSLCIYYWGHNIIQLYSLVCNFNILVFLAS